MLILLRRTELGLTQDHIAERAGIAKSYVSQIENQVRKGPPSEEILHKLERALKMDPGSLIDAARWENTPASVKRYVERVDGAAKVLANSLRTAVGRGNLDELHRSGELERLVSRIEGTHRPAIAVAPSARSSPGTSAPISPWSLQPAPASSLPSRANASTPPTDPWRIGARNQELQELPLHHAMPAHIPLINSVAAGHPCEYTDLSHPVGIADEYVRSPDLGDREAFAARISGESMSPEYLDGDIVVFSPLRAITSGTDCFVRFEDRHESTFKRIFFEPDPNASDAANNPDPNAHSLIRLQPLNPAFPARTVSREAIAAMYAAVSVTRAAPHPDPSRRPSL